MFCPKCGAGEQREKAYCARCGEWLPDLKAVVRRQFGGATPQENVRTILIFNLLSTLFALLAAAALYATYFGHGIGKWALQFAASFCLVVAGWQITNFFIALKLRQRFKKGRESETAHALEAGERALSSADTAQFLDASSVMETPTESLDPVSRGEHGKRR